MIGVDVSHHQGDIDWPVLAHTDVASPISKPPRAETSATGGLIWQYHNCARRAGIEGPVDLNAFRGPRRDLEAFAAGEAVRW